jgi:spore cortex formation protein SpoVR/YcgB (stage V sporulation)
VAIVSKVRQPDDGDAAVAWIEEHGQELTDWQRQFLGTMMKSEGRFQIGRR